MENNRFLTFVFVFPCFFRQAFNNEAAMHGVTWRITAFSLILGLALNALSYSAGADDALILGVHPYLPPKDLIKRFEPLAGYLGKAIGRPVEVRKERKGVRNHIYDTASRWPINGS